MSRHAVMLHTNFAYMRRPKTCDAFKEKLEKERDIACTTILVVPLISIRFHSSRLPTPALSNLITSCTGSSGASNSPATAP